MALFHKATITPSKAEVLSEWVPQQPWSPGTGEVDVVGAFRFNDPEGQVGIETFLVRMDGVLLHVPVTYRAEPLAGAEDALVGEMHHSALGNRWVYDGARDQMHLTMLAAVAMTGQGEALGMVEYDDRWVIAPAAVRIEGGGWNGERVPVDQFATVDASATDVVFANDRFSLTMYRRPTPQERPPLGLSARWDGIPAPVLLAVVAET